MATPADNSLASPIDNEDQQILDKLRLLLNQDKDLVCPTDDVYLLRFLRYKKNDVDKTYKSIVSWWKDRHRLKSLHDDLHPSNYNEHYHNKFSTTLCHRDKFGRQVVIWKMKGWDASNVPLLDMFKSNFCIVDTISSRQLTQLHGSVFIMDLTGLSLSHVKACTPSSLKAILSLADGFPLKIKGIHFVNHPPIFNAVWAIAKLLMKPKMKKRVQFHGYSHTSLHEHVGQDILPKTYGGFLEENEFEESQFVQEMLDKEQYYIDLFDINKYGYHVKK